MVHATFPTAWNSGWFEMNGDLYVVEFVLQGLVAPAAVVAPRACPRIARVVESGEPVGQHLIHGALLPLLHIGCVRAQHSDQEEQGSHGFAVAGQRRVALHNLKHQIETPGRYWKERGCSETVPLLVCSFLSRSIHEGSTDFEKPKKSIVTMASSALICFRVCVLFS